MLGGIEAGGTKFVCAVGSGPDALHDEARFATTTPAETIASVVAFFARHRASLDAVGIASFGPLDLDPASETHGWITRTPKEGWAQTDLRGAIARALSLPVAVDTDVNAAALAEHRWGAARDVSSVLYVTVGTGIGGGAVLDGKPLHGLVHPEMGHVRIPREPGDRFEGVCPFHGDCLEGLASGPALERRWGRRAEELPADHPAWAMEARALALGLTSAISILSPSRIVLGGGVARQPALLPLVRAEVKRLLAGYIPARALEDEIDGYIVAPGLGERSGVLGALALAREATRPRLASVTYLVRDYDEAIAFFTQALGFELLEDEPLEGGKRWVRVAPRAGAGTSLLLARAATSEQAAHVGKEAGGRVAFFLHTDDFAREHAALRARGVRFTEEPRDELYGKVAVFLDLYGNRWDLVEPRADVSRRG